MAENKDVVITDDMLNKALETLGLLTPEANDLSKGESFEHEKKETKTQEKKEQATGDKDEKGGSGDEKPDLDDEEDDEEIKKAAKDFEEMEKAYNLKKSEFEGMKNKKKKAVTPEMMKSEISDIIKAELNPLSDKFGSVTESFGVIAKSLIQENNLLKKSLSETNETLSKINELVSIMGNQSLGRKSIMKSQAIEKSFGGTPVESGKTQLSLSRDKARIEETLLSLANFESGNPNMFYANAATLVNTSNMLNKAIESDLSQNHNIQIVE